MANVNKREVIHKLFITGKYTIEEISEVMKLDKMVVSRYIEEGLAASALKKKQDEANDLDYKEFFCKQKVDDFVLITTNPKIRELHDKLFLNN